MLWQSHERALRDSFSTPPRINWYHQQAQAASLSYSPRLNCQTIGCMSQKFGLIGNRHLGLMLQRCLGQENWLNGGRDMYGS